MKKNHPYISSFIFAFLSGLCISALAILVIYFKQKDHIHHGLILFTISLIFFFGIMIQNQQVKISSSLKTVSITVLILISLLAPQFIYQIRPYTFYISGFAFALILLISGSAITLPNGISAYKWSFLFVLMGYLAGNFIPI